MEMDKGDPIDTQSLKCLCHSIEGTERVLSKGDKIMNSANKDATAYAKVVIKLSCDFLTILYHPLHSSSPSR